MKVLQFNVGMMDVCCYIAACEKTGQAVVIDPGGDEESILSTIKKERLSLTAIVNTHGHPDHVCGNARIRDATGAPILMHADDDDFFARPLTKQYFSMLGLSASPAADKRLAHMDRIAFGSEELLVIHTPGHTPGGICLYSAPHLFSGDTLFAGAVGRTDFPGGNGGQLMTSIRSRLLVLPPDTIVWPGHSYGGKSSTIAQESRSNPYLTEAY